MSKPTFPALPVPEYTQLIQVYEKLNADLLATSDDVARLRGTRPNGTWPDGQPRYSDGELAAAIAADAKAQADAMRTGDKDPGRANTKRVAKALDDAQAKYEAVLIAVADAEREATEWLAENCDDAADAVEDAAEDDRATYLASIDAMVTARETYWRNQRPIGWLRAGAEGSPKVEAAPPGLVGGFETPNGEPMTVAPLLNALRVETEPPVPVRKGHWERVPDKVFSANGTLLEDRGTFQKVYDHAAQPGAADGGLFIDGVPVYVGTDNNQED